jgi:hypothetical protein
MNNKDKSLLKESTIRRFMKLAAIEPLTETFVSNIEEEKQKDHKWKTLEEQDEMEELEGEEPEMEAPEGEEPPAEEFGMEDETEEPTGDVDVESLVSAIADAIEQETGVEVSVEGTEGEEFEGEELEGEEPEADMSEPSPEDLRPDEGEEMPPEELQERFEGMVNEVARRVAARLLN